MCYISMSKLAKKISQEPFTLANRSYQGSMSVLKCYQIITRSVFSTLHPRLLERQRLHGIHRSFDWMLVRIDLVHGHPPCQHLHELKRAFITRCGKVGEEFLSGEALLICATSISLQSPPRSAIFSDTVNYY